MHNVALDYFAVNTNVLSRCFLQRCFFFPWTRLYVFICFKVICKAHNTVIIFHMPIQLI